MNGQNVEFDRTPFSVSSIRKLDCQFGQHFYKDYQGKSDHTRLQGSRKIGCKAHIVVRTITLYPDFKLSKSETASIGP